jgi:hypothetical protein
MLILPRASIGSSGFLKRERAAEEGKTEKPKVRELIKQKRAKFQTADPLESELHRPAGSTTTIP